MRRTVGECMCLHCGQICVKRTLSASQDWSLAPHVQLVITSLPTEALSARVARLTNDLSRHIVQASGGYNCNYN